MWCNHLQHSSPASFCKSGGSQQYAASVQTQRGHFFRRWMIWKRFHCFCLRIKLPLQSIIVCKLHQVSMLQFCPEKGMLLSLLLSHGLLMLTIQNGWLQQHFVPLFTVRYCRIWVDRLIQDCFHHATTNAKNAWITMPSFPNHRNTICTSIFNRQ